MSIITKTVGIPPSGGEETKTHNERLISVKHLAEICSMSQRAIWRLLASGALPKPIKVGRCTRFLQSDVFQWLNELKEQSV